MSASVPHIAARWAVRDSGTSCRNSDPTDPTDNGFGSDDGFPASNAAHQVMATAAASRSLVRALASLKDTVVLVVLDQDHDTQDGPRLTMTSYSVSELDPSLKGALPANFQWGYATAAAQVGGAWNKDGKGLSIWDIWCHEEPSRVNDTSTNEDAVRSYDFYKEDVARMKDYGVAAYRFSLAWSRIIPLGGKDDPVNE